MVLQIFHEGFRANLVLLLDCRKTRDKPKMEITLAKSDRFDAIVAAEAEAVASGLQSLQDVGSSMFDDVYLDDIGDFSSNDLGLFFTGQQYQSSQVHKKRGHLVHNKSVC